MTQLEELVKIRKEMVKLRKLIQVLIKDLCARMEIDPKEADPTG